MGLITDIKTLIHGKTAEAVESYLITLGGTSLKVLATSQLGVALQAAYKAGEAGTNPVQKIGLAIESLTPTIEQALTKAGRTAIASDVETAARLAMEDFLAQVRTTGPLTIIETLESIAITAL